MAPVKGKPKKKAPVNKSEGSSRKIASTRARKTLELKAIADLIQLQGLGARPSLTGRQLIPPDQFTDLAGSLSPSCSSPTPPPTQITSTSGTTSQPSSTSTSSGIEPALSKTIEEIEKERMENLRLILKGMKNKPLTIYLRTSMASVVGGIADQFDLFPVHFKEMWNVCWTDFPLDLEKVMAIQYYQIVNHFPAMSCLARKDLLANNLNKMIKLFPDDYRIFPKTWVLPDDFEKVQAYQLSHKKQVYAFKPRSGSKGQGIYLLRNTERLNPFAEGVCQIYLKRPYLLDGLKFDFRVFVLITSVEPLRVYVHEEGLARFATRKYKNPVRFPSSSFNSLMHLTNYAVNKTSSNYNSDPTVGSKRRLTTVLAQLASKGCKIEKIITQMDDVILKTIISGHPLLKETYEKCFADRKYACFEVLGFDIMIDHKQRPFLLEVNQAPSFSVYSSVDSAVKETVITDTFAMLKLDRLDLKDVLVDAKKREKTRLKSSFTGQGGKSSSRTTPSAGKQSTNAGTTIVSPKPRLIPDTQFVHELKNKGGFRLIYPSKTARSKYAKFFGQEEPTNSNNP